MLSHYFILLLQRLCIVAVSCFLIASNSYAAEFDHSHEQLSQLLNDVVVLSEDKKQSRVNYKKVHVQTQQLDAYLIALSDVNKVQYDSWEHDQRLSFLINAYNGYTLKLINDNWDEFKKGDANSIRDLGTFFTNPWEKSFFTLFGEKHSLDDIEHEMIRKWFKRPRIHAALVCAAVSCPPLRNEAFVATQLDSQLDDQMLIFLADNNRNDISIKNGKATIELSPIFKWYGEDFEKGHNGFNSLGDLLKAYKKALVEGDDDIEAKINAISKGNYQIRFNEYDWALNDVSSF